MEPDKISERQRGLRVAVVMLAPWALFATIVGLVGLLASRLHP